MNFNKIVASVIKEVTTGNNNIGLIIVFMLLAILLVLIYFIYINKKS
ncbi:MAG: hypothetical protein IJ094_09425 [Bacilli bacterium]|nr:hypothetical protein [Bacilli bacterium]